MRRPFAFIAGHLLAALLLLTAVATADARSFQLGDLEIGYPFARATAGRTGAAYLSVANKGRTPDRLLSARTTEATATELHATVRDGEVMKMRPAGIVDLPAGQTVRFEPGGLHVMLIGLVRPLKEGDRISLTLVFEKAGAIEVVVNVEKAGSAAPAHSH